MSTVRKASICAACAFRRVGIAMPTKSSARWIDDGNNIVKVLKERGYGTDLQYAEDDIPNQLAQIENMVTKGAKVLVIAAIDGTTLSDVLQQAKDKGIKVIAYDRLIRDTKNVDYYATFDNFQVGVLQAQSIVEGLGLKEGKGPFNIELFGGSPDDNNAFFFYNGAMSVLQPYIDSGKLVVKQRPDGHGQGRHAALGRRHRPGPHGQPAERLLHQRKRVDAVLSPYDGLSIGILSSLKGVGYGSGEQPMPIVTGQDAEVPSVKSMLRGEQYSTDLQGHPRTRQGHRRHGRRGAERQGSRGQRHQDLQQRRQGRAVLPAEAGQRRQDQLGEDPDRQRLLQESQIK
jgi:putative multiple sugar transport system substrate-binding protein